MEKLLHERLRELAEKPSGCAVCKKYHHGECPPYDCDTALGSIFNQIADEIERNYIPYPRFENGEPVHLGYEIEIYDRSGLLDKGIIQSFYPDKGSVWMISLVGCDHERLVRFDPETCVIKRPTPKVYDADGVEIKVGDIVYDISFSSDSHKPIRVERIEDDGRLLCQYDVGKLGHYLPNEVSHECPVFDAEGVRYTKGQTVWSLSGVEYIVDEVIDDDHIRVRRPDSEKAHATFTSRTLTHREPDSIEKLRDDMVMTHDAADEPCSTTEEWIDRLTALIERGSNA